jgi:SAM-dependent methyltransferase
VGCRVVGLDVNGEGIRHAVELACREKLTDRATFELCDISKTLPLEDAIFDAVYSNDVLCHVPGRAQVLSELRRVLRPAGRLLFSDALVITGLVSHQEIAARSSLAEHFFSPPGENERSIEQAGFHLVGIRDTTAGIAELSRRCRDAREIRKLDLLAIEGEETFAGMQQFLSVVHRLTAEGRVRRFLYVAEA